MQDRLAGGHRAGPLALEELQRGLDLAIVEFHPLAADADERDLERGEFGQFRGGQHLVADGQVVPELHEVREAECGLPWPTARPPPSSTWWSASARAAPCAPSPARARRTPRRPAAGPRRGGTAARPRCPARPRPGRPRPAPPRARGTAGPPRRGPPGVPRPGTCHRRASRRPPRPRHRPRTASGSDPPRTGARTRPATRCRRGRRPRPALQGLRSRPAPPGGSRCGPGPPGAWRWSATLPEPRPGTAPRPRPAVCPPRRARLDR